MLKILCVFGTRPEVIKMAPVVKHLRMHPEHIDCKVCVTGQHRQMIDPLIKLFGLQVDYDLNIMQPNQGLEHITTRVLKEIGELIDREKPDYLVVQGDTTTAMAGGLAAFYRKVKVAHVEAGLRTWDKQHPFPEEVNRRIIDSFADLYFPHTDAARQNLLKEGVDDKLIEVTGNTVIDALLETSERPFDVGTIVPESFLDGRRLIVVTAHRRENFDEPIRNICKALKSIADRFPKDVAIIYPVHLNPNIRGPVQEILAGSTNIRLAEPLDYLPFVHLMKRSYLILTDSGGLQEEAPSLGKPVLVMRQTTERPEGVKAGCVKVIGTEIENIVENVSELLNTPSSYDRMAQAANPYGDGKAGDRIARRFIKESGKGRA
ncbi:MAG: UDP-N-acetylglucosamine 2-epimerase (non-hydrolyzing) [Nitrospinae bacterium CG11_big_fil_rev_8_21_14_0_20_56_8]|nr:MAG: UDP-N-acetylglucosamine 2-epimerase (non-hydrolyzing) [Nitrospinae bacterium CG11_big_fil_rev_8_21_14_0_20_56_8]